MSDAYAKGYTHGSTRGHLYDPPWNYTEGQRKEYLAGFNDGVQNGY